MKYLKGLELQNFKSYDGVHSITFMQLTSIIGPNGAGKQRNFIFLSRKELH